VPRYHFNIRNTDPFKDEEGITLAGDLAAREHAIQIVNELKKGDPESWIGYVMEVMREGSVVWVIPFDRPSLPG
jgi:Domain of unknown function (DUF6894)